MLIVLYLVAIVLANLSVHYFGPTSTIINAFLFIGLDLSVRDKLHETFASNRKLKMFLLIASGSTISYVINNDVYQIAVASCVAFGIAGLVDYAVYSILDKHSKFLRVNTSNVFASATDSILFPAIAFGFPLLYLVMAGQFVAKVVGGLLWYSILFRKTLPK